jgi:hypothetical protein
MSHEPKISAAPVPVFNCVVNVARNSDGGEFVARVVNLAGIEGRGRSEREAMAQAVGAFKAEVARLHASGQTIAFLEPAPPQPHETQRLIAVHL